MIDVEKIIRTAITKKIEGFEGVYSFLSNFDNTYPLHFFPIAYLDPLTSSITEKHYTIPTTEHAFQAFKVFKDWKHPLETEKEAFEKFLEYDTPGKAKRAGRKIPLDSEYWDSVKDDVMYYVCSWKFRLNMYYRDMLLETGDYYLEETNTWGDKYWGVCRGEGLNHLGLILMRIREEIRRDYEMHSTL